MASLTIANTAKAIKNPNILLRYTRTLGRGYIYKTWCYLTNKRVTIGRNFHLDGWVSIKGPGRVVIGDNVRIGGFTTPWTFKRDAVIEIGDNVFLNSTRFACADNIKVGNYSLLADCRVMDTNFHSEDPNFRHGFYDTPEPIIIGRNTWITIQTVVLKGTTIGDNTILSPNSVVSGAKLLPNKIYMGNPARAVKAL